MTKRVSKPTIVKVQLSLNTNISPPSVLIYDRLRTRICQISMSHLTERQLMEFLGRNSFKEFFEAVWSRSDRCWQLRDRVPHQNW